MTPSRLSYAIAFAIAVGYLALAFWFPIGYIWATYENLYGEWLQVGLWWLTAFVCIACAMHRKDVRLFFSALSVAAIYVAMEEVSWGQQLFNWESPEFFQRHSLQNETNLHNLLTGPFSTTLKDTIRVVLGTGLWAYGIAYPLMLRGQIRIALWAQRIGVAPPPLYTWPFFFFGGLWELGLFDFNEAEAAEVMVASGFLITALSYWYRLMPDPQPVESEQPARSIALAFLIAVLFSGSMTSVILARGYTRDLALERIEWGVESFAGRYAAYGQWEVTIRLLERYIRSEPTAISAYRDLTDAYREVGKYEAATEILHKALPIDQRRLADNPEDESAHRSIARTMKSLGDFETANIHAERALQICEEYVEEWPEDSEGWYSLALSLDQVNRQPEALEAIGKAIEIDPNWLPYRSVYLKLTAILAAKERMAAKRAALQSP